VPGVFSFLLAALVPARRRADECDALLPRVAAGDRAALRALYDELSPVALALALRVLRSRGDAEEVVQDAFVEIWRRAGAFDPARGSGRAWAISIVRYRAIDRLRSRGAIDRLADRAAGGEVAAPPRDPVEDVAHRRLRDRVHAALTDLSADERRALELAYYEGLSHSEIAQRLATPVGTIKTRVRAAMAKLSGVLHQEDLP
jgi:RNA polymerase sigma-70 factor (ECF subfamily)